MILTGTINKLTIVQELKAEILMRLKHRHFQDVLKILQPLPDFYKVTRANKYDPFINIHLSLDGALTSLVVKWFDMPKNRVQLCLAAFILFGLSSDKMPFPGCVSSQRNFLHGLVSRLSESSAENKVCDLFKTCLCESREAFATQRHILQTEKNNAYRTGYTYM